MVSSTREFGRLFCGALSAIFASRTREPDCLGIARPLGVSMFLVLALLVSTIILPRQAQALVVTPVAPTPAVLTAVSADAATGETRILLTFAPLAPNYSIITNDSDKPAIAFALSSRGSAAVLPAGQYGLLRAISFSQNDTILVVSFAAVAKARITATPIGGAAISISLVPSLPAGAVAAVRPPAPVLPKAVARPPGEDGFETVYLKYADVSEVVGLLTEGLSVKSNDNFIPREPTFGSMAAGGAASFSPAQPGAAEPVSEPYGQSVNDEIAVDRRLNAIILKGSPDRIARLKQKIALIDVPMDSVVLETEFVELDETGARNVGLDYNNTNGQVAVANFQTGGFIPLGLPTDRPLTSASLQAAIYGQVQSGRGRIVSKPRIAAQSGSAAKIITGQALPILTSITISGVNAVSQQVQYVNVGVTLQIAPRVSSDGFVTSHVFCVISNVTGFSQGYPTISQREAETSATVRDGETFVIGGLTEDSNSTTNSKLPGLGDIPMLGEFFKLHKGSSAKSDLYIMITPHIVRRTGVSVASAN